MKEKENIVELRYEHNNIIKMRKTLYEPLFDNFYLLNVRSIFLFFHLK